MSNLIAKVDQLPVQQAAIADVPTGAVILLSDAITAIGQLRSALNTLLAELRAAGLIAP
jgi:hypothetical protein